MPVRQKRTRKTATRKRKKATRKRSTKSKPIKVKVSPKVAREIWAITYFALGLITILSLQGTFGVLGEAWTSLLKPILGFGVYIIPAIFMFVSLALFFAKSFEFVFTKVLGVILFMTSILSILHLSIPVEQIYEFASQGSHGGYIGFVTNFILLEFLKVGEIGAAVIFVALFLVSLLLIFEVSLKEIVKFMLPEIKFEVVSEGGSRRRKTSLKANLKSDDNDVSDEQLKPEITIHKSKISNTKKDRDTLSDEDDVVMPKLRKEDGTIAGGQNSTQPTLLDDKPVMSKKDAKWEFPSLDLLSEGVSTVEIDEKILMEVAKKIRDKLMQFGIKVKMHEVNVGPTVIQYTLKPDEGVKLSKITSLKNDLALAIAAERIRIEAPIPGKSLVGIEIPNGNRATVHLRELLETPEFKESDSKMTFALGRDVSGKPVVADLATMPHLLIAGATGSGKSVGLNSFLIALLYQNSPEELKMIMIDPKRVELNNYNNIPHLLTPVIEDPEKAAVSLKWVVAEMNRRYKELSRYRVRNLAEYNDLEEVDDMPKIVVVIDELADLMMTAGKEVEASICRIAQMARAVGIHLIIATQRPSVDVITGLIKANIPTRIAFAVSSSVDSRTVIDSTGAEDLLGKGDMLYLATGKNKPQRVQGIFVSLEEVERVTKRIRLTEQPDFDESITSTAVARANVSGVPEANSLSDVDEMYNDALELVRESRKASASMLQRRLKVGYARAARIIDQLEENGVVGPSRGAKPRKILM